jgi:predicted enzyme related to lactoylglutathione lyase
MQSIIHTPTPDLSKSLEFYERLNFQILRREPTALVSDGKFLLEINPDRYARAGVKLYADSWEDAVGRLEKLTEVHMIEQGYLLADPSNVWIYLIKGDAAWEGDMEGETGSILGKYAGLSLETSDMKRSAAIWEALGFSLSMGSVEQGWIGYQNESGLGVSFMKPNTCPHLFFNPSLTFFNGGNNPAVIKKIREAGIPITEEITHFNKEGIVDNVIIRDPGGYGFFVFND